METNNKKKFAPKVPKGTIQVGDEVNETETETTEEAVDTENVDTVDSTVETDSNTEVEENSDTDSEEVTMQSPEEETNNTDSVEMVKTEDKLVAERNVKVKTSMNYNCCIGGERYSFEKDKVQSVPLNVKLILEKEDNLLKPL
jgi:hypothetical protein